MKLCKACGAINSDERMFCVDCEQKLGEVVAESERQQLENGIAERVERLYKQQDPLYVSVFDKVCGAVSLCGLVACVALLVVGVCTQRNVAFLWYAVLLFGLAIVEALVPRLSWELEKLRLNFLIADADNAEPSGFYRVSRKVAIVVTAVIGVILLTMAIREYRQVPVVQYVDDIANTKSVSSNVYDYIAEHPETWGAIIESGDYAVGVFTNELKEATVTGLRERLMMLAIEEITGQELSALSQPKETFLFELQTNER